MSISLENLNAEEKLLVQLCRMHFTEVQEEEIKLLTGLVKDWERFLKLANEHGVIALTAYNLIRCKTQDAGRKTQDDVTAYEVKEIPERVMKVLENGLMQSVMRNAWLAERWREVNNILNESGIKHILLKGMALEHTIYESGGLRQMNDNDILLKREDCLKAWHLLRGNGFTIEPVKSPLHSKILTDIGKHLPTLYKDGYALEIHHRLTSAAGKGKESNTDYFTDAEPITVGNMQALVLSRKNQIIHLLSHLETHMQEGSCQLRLYTDIALLDESVLPVFPSHFLMKPHQVMSMKQRKEVYRKTLNSLDRRFRLRFIIGDTFPSIEWMKKRHSCNTIKAFLFYPRRIGKLWWMI